MEPFLAALTALGHWLAALADQYPWLEPASAVLGIVGAAAAAAFGLHKWIVGKA